MSKSQKIKIGAKSKRLPLEKQVLNDVEGRASTRQKIRRRMDADDEFVDENLSRKIIEQAKQQQAELEEEYGIGENIAETKTISLGTGENASESEESDSDIGEESYYEDIEVAEEDEMALETFMSNSAPIRRTLYDIIKEKLAEKETEIQTQLSDVGSMNVSELDERVVEMYKGVKQVLSRYRSGKLPKAFKVIPALSNWEQILYLTEPDNWSAASMYQATRIFASNLKDKMAQRFFNLVLLPRIQDDIAEYKKLNFHLYEALRKALFKPGAFFKGIILPLCESRTCTLREAIIISSVIAKNSIPMLHSGAAILKIAEMEYTGANSIFLRVLLDKKYALPFRVIDAMVYHFLRFQTDKRQLPVLWHQCFLTFAQRYKEDVSSEQKEALLELLKIHYHHSITQEIRRELQHSKCRDVEMDQPM